MPFLDQSSVGGHHSDLVLYFLFEQVPILLQIYYIGNVFILHHLQRNAYLISRCESHCTNAHGVQNLAI